MNPPVEQTITLVTGANKGLGLETVRRLRDAGHTVLLSARDVDRGKRAADGLGVDRAERRLGAALAPEVRGCLRHHRVQKHGKPAQRLGSGVQVRSWACARSRPPRHRSRVWARSRDRQRGA